MRPKSSPGTPMAPQCDSGCMQHEHVWTISTINDRHSREIRATASASGPQGHGSEHAARPWVFSRTIRKRRPCVALAARGGRQFRRNTGSHRSPDHLIEAGGSAGRDLPRWSIYTATNCQRGRKQAQIERSGLHLAARLGSISRSFQIT